MKVKEYLEQAKTELEEEKSHAVIAIIKDLEKDLASAKKIVKRLEKTKEELLEKDIDELELDGYEY